mmetsp:Transcript_40524/g.75287  ORF Transcript_40524/g.75287 Transcript_40524/m.75287 type:complete len:899 (-) Transcript_40524:144-2840(-)
MVAHQEATGDRHGTHKKANAQESLNHWKAVAKLLLVFNAAATFSTSGLGARFPVANPNMPMSLVSPGSGIHRVPVMTATQARHIAVTLTTPGPQLDRNRQEMLRVLKERASYEAQRRLEERHEEAKRLEHLKQGNMTEFRGPPERQAVVQTQQEAERSEEQSVFQKELEQHEGTSTQVVNENYLQSLPVRDLKAKLRSLGLKVSGIKEDLIARLEKYADDKMTGQERTLQEKLELLEAEVKQDLHDLRALTMKELKAKLKAVGMKVSGSKQELIARLHDHAEQMSQTKERTHQESIQHKANVASLSESSSQLTEPELRKYAIHGKNGVSGLRKDAPHGIGHDAPLVNETMGASDYAVAPELSKDDALHGTRNDAPSINSTKGTSAEAAAPELRKDALNGIQGTEGTPDEAAKAEVLESALHGVRNDAPSVNETRRSDAPPANGTKSTSIEAAGPEQRIDGLQAETKGASDEAAALRRAEIDKVHELERVSFASLPPKLRERRLASQRMTLTEYVDYAEAQRVLQELDCAAHNISLPQPQREEAEYLHQYLYDFFALLQLEATPQAILPPGCAVNADTRLVLARDYAYFSRHGGGRRYTTIERRMQSQRGREKLYAAPRSDGAVSRIADRRAYGLQGCPRALRAQLCGAYAHDVDMKSAHPTIAIQLRKMLLQEEQNEVARTLLAKATLENFEDYVAHRDTPETGWIDSVSRHHRIEGPFEQRKECIKKLFCRLMFGGSYAAWMKLPYGKDASRHPLGEKMDQVVQMERELARLRRAVFASSQWRGFVEAEMDWVRHEAARSGRKFNPYTAGRSIFSRIMQTIENDILDQLVVSLRAQGWHITTLIFDGCHVLHRPDASLREALVRAEEHIKNSTGFAIELAEKPLHGEHAAPVELTRI